MKGIQDLKVSSFRGRSIIILLNIRQRIYPSKIAAAELGLNPLGHFVAASDKAPFRSASSSCSVSEPLRHIGDED